MFESLLLLFLICTVGRRCVLSVIIDYRSCSSNSILWTYLFVAKNEAFGLNEYSNNHYIHECLCPLHRIHPFYHAPVHRFSVGIHSSITRIKKRSECRAFINSYHCYCITGKMSHFKMPESLFITTREYE